ncbi:hypothetical protein EUGRSUZ_F01669 [Eucalyptus grandis]|uniref:Bulb-type lectin domain-containing protein n=2 Tax=Eucalyptus grandis TaxID=71139 RepID=A0A059BQH8_EUCGR|nr:hypothetical protein EUGRSUZ_F01669 [Eucalyptus grandis]
MEGISLRASTFLFLYALLFSHFAASLAQSGAGTIHRTKDQLLLASLQPSTGTTSTSPGSISSQLFLTSPSGSSAAYLVRPVNSASSSDNDYCYIQVQGGGSAVWKSTCASVSQANTCSLVLSGSGLEIFDGSQSSWRTNVNGGHRRNPETLLLLDGGDLHIRDQSGRIVWTASESQAVGQTCGSFGTPRENFAFSPFGSPSYEDKPESLPSSSSSSSSPLRQSLDQIGEESEMGYNNNYQQQQETMNYPQQQMPNRPSLTGFNQPFSTQNQPFGASNQDGLADNGPFENGVSEKRLRISVVLGSLFTLLGCLHSFL